MAEPSENKKEMLKQIIKQLHGGAKPEEVKERFKGILEGVTRPSGSLQRTTWKRKGGNTSRKPDLHSKEGTRDNTEAFGGAKLSRSQGPPGGGKEPDSR